MIKKLVYFSVFCNKARLKSLKITVLYEHVSMASKHDLIVSVHGRLCLYVL